MSTVRPHVLATTAAGDPSLPPQLQRFLRRPEAIRTVFQPIVDVARGTVVGYEALARFEDPTITDVEAFFAAAQAHAVADQVEAAALRAAFAHRPSLPPTCFLTVNVAPHLLASAAVRDVLDEQGDLAGVVLELTEHSAIDSYAGLEPHLERYRDAGALIAVDDAGSGYAGLRHLLDLRPAIIKVDRHFVRDIHRDSAKRLLIEMLGTFADRTDCWLLAEGVERVEELDAVATLGVPLVQGYLTGRPAAPWGQLPADIATRLAARAAPATNDTVHGVLEPCLSASTVEEAAQLLSGRVDLDLVVVIDEQQRPTVLVDVDSAVAGVTTDAMRVQLDTAVDLAARRAVGRPPQARFLPLAVTDAAGRFVGIARMERLIERLSRSGT